MRIVFFGTPEFSRAFLEDLVEDPRFTVVGVVAQPDEPVGRKRVLTSPPTVAFAKEQGIPFLQPTKLKTEEFQRALASYAADAFIVVAYGRIIPEHILAIPRLGAINVHPSLLPKLRGPSPMQTAIANLEKATGVSIMLLDKDMDHGPILAQLPLPLSEETTLETLVHDVVTQGSPLLRETILSYQAGTCIPQPQRHEEATFCHLLSKEDGVITSKDSAEILFARLRGYTPWPGVRTTVILDDGTSQEIKILEGRLGSEEMHHFTKELPIGGCVASTTQDALLIKMSSGIFAITTLQPSTKPSMHARAYLQGYRPVRLER